MKFPVEIIALENGTDKFGFRVGNQDFRFAEQFLFFLPSSSAKNSSATAPQGERPKDKLHLARKLYLGGKCGLSLVDDCERIGHALNVRLKPAKMLRILNAAANGMVEMLVNGAKPEEFREIAKNVCADPRKSKRARGTTIGQIIDGMLEKNTFLEAGLANSVALMAELSARVAEGTIINTKQWRVQGVEIMFHLAKPHKCSELQDMIRFALGQKTALAETGLTGIFGKNPDKIPLEIRKQAANMLDVDVRMGKLIESDATPVTGPRMADTLPDFDNRPFGIKNKAKLPADDIFTNPSTLRDLASRMSAALIRSPTAGCSRSRE